MVRFFFYVRYPASFFTVVDHLSRWDIHSHMWYYEDWVIKYGLTERQKLLLEKYRVIRKKYPWGQMEPIFMYADTLEDAWKKASSKIASDEVQFLKEIFAAFKDNFDREWQGHQYLHRKKEAYKRIIKQYDIESAFKEVQRFYDVADFEREIDVHLLYNPSRTHGGGSAQAGIQSEEGPDEREESIIRGIAGLLHEAFHLLEPRRKIEETLMKSGIEHDEAEIVREAAMDSLVPKGIIAKKFLDRDWQDEMRRTGNLQRRFSMAKDDIEKKSILFYLMRHKLSFALLPLTQSYLEQDKTVWDNYWNKALKLYFRIKDYVQRLCITSNFTYII